jgi:hypothetical protein
MLGGSMTANYTLRGATSAAHVYQTSLTVTATGNKDLGP